MQFGRPAGRCPQAQRRPVSAQLPPPAQGRRPPHFPPAALSRTPEMNSALKAKARPCGHSAFARILHATQLWCLPREPRAQPLSLAHPCTLHEGPMLFTNSAPGARHTSLSVGLWPHPTAVCAGTPRGWQPQCGHQPSDEGPEGRQGSGQVKQRALRAAERACRQWRARMRILRQHAAACTRTHVLIRRSWRLVPASGEGPGQKRRRGPGILCNGHYPPLKRASGVIWFTQGCVAAP